MTRMISLPAVFVSTALALGMTAPSLANGESRIQVTISGLDAQRGGQVQVGLYASEASWDEQDAITGEMAHVDGDTVTVVFENLADGAYGIMLFQDFDSDGELDMNAFGIPSEPYAFSNNATGRFGPARWSDAHFMVAGSAEQSISLD
ncbi:DUF2141 domain-containing protein [Maricaulis sp. D1M11]|uniref:DUF2141 domain-containing protein n=1 Tax=Maricaulis sp. D1M11 TaxID=3076117 RepID=UPI0039B6328A